MAIRIEPKETGLFVTDTTTGQTRGPIDPKDLQDVHLTAIYVTACEIAKRNAATPMMEGQTR